MPTHKGLRSDDRDGIENQWKPSIQLDEEQAISVGEVNHDHAPSAAVQCRRRGGSQPWRRQRRTAAAGHCALTLITRTRDLLERSINACEQISSSMSATSISVVGSHCKVLGISPGQMRHAELPGCCAHAASGHAAVPPMSVMNSRRLMQAVI
jgi:hypothetical protein